MSMKVEIKDGQGTGLLTKVQEGRTLPGVTVYPEIREKIGAYLRATNSTGSANLAVDASPAASELINDGGDTVAWTATATGNVDLTSTTQAFDGTQSVEWPAAGASQGAEARFARPSGEITVTAGKTLTGQIYLEAFIAGSEFQVRFRNNGGNETPWTDITGFIDTGIIGAWQPFNIPLSFFGGLAEFDEVRVRKRNNNTSFFVDVLSVDSPAGGDEGTFELGAFDPTLNNSRITVKTLSLYIESTDTSTLADAALPNISPSNFGAKIGLVDGVQLTFNDGEGNLTTFALQTNRGLIAQFQPEVQAGGDGTSQWVLFTWDLPYPVTFKPNSPQSISMTVNDDLSGYDFILFDAKGVVDPLDNI